MNPLAAIPMLLALAGAGGEPCFQLAPIPTPEYVPVRPDPKPRLERSHDLMSLFSRGDGRLIQRSSLDADRIDVPGALRLRALPWTGIPERVRAARLATWRGEKRLDAESMLVFVLRAGDSWCTPVLDLGTGSRLRFEPLQIERGTNPLLDVVWVPAGGARERLYGARPHVPFVFSTESQVDLSLRTGSGSVCFEAHGGAVAVGDPRILVPGSPSAEDPRPRWIVLAIVDALRGDVLTGPFGGPPSLDLAPAIRGLMATGWRFPNAVSPGCHTRAALFPILTGRDLFRINPFARSHRGDDAEAAAYARGNVLLTHVAESAGYHALFLGNNELLHGLPGSSRYSSPSDLSTGTFDTVTRLPALMSRYADERVFLIYYVSAPHGHSATPQRLFDELGCSPLKGVEQCRCAYSARVRHADEAIRALEIALLDHGLLADTIQILTADHGESFDDGLPLEARITGTWRRLDRLHGYSCRPSEVRVPLIVTGPGVRAGESDAAVTSLDLFPTLLGWLKRGAISRLDGRPLPMAATGTPPKGRALISYGFCTHSIVEGDLQALWWEPECAERRTIEGKLAVTGRAQLFRAEREVTREDASSGELERLLDLHRSWIRDRAPRAGLVLDLSALSRARVAVSVRNGRISDFGPHATGSEVRGIGRVAIDEAARTLEIETDDYRGMFYVATDPPLAALEVDISTGGVLSPDRVASVGPLQLPLPVLGRTLDPSSRPDLFLAETSPDPRREGKPRLRLWWLAPAPKDARAPSAISDFQRVLREWGYVR